jgi:hypothetical protein
LLTALAAMFIVLPFVDELPVGNLVESIIFSAVMLAGLYTLGGTQRTLLAALLLAIPTLRQQPLLLSLLSRWPDPRQFRRADRGLICPAADRDDALITPAAMAVNHQSGL